MKTGRILHQSQKIGGKIREIRSGAVAVSKDTIGKDLLATRLEKRIVLGGWTGEIGHHVPQHSGVECREVRTAESAQVGGDGGKRSRITPNPISIPKLSGRSKRIEIRIPRIGQKCSITQKIQAVRIEVVAMPQPAEVVPKISEQFAAEAPESPRIEAKAREEARLKRRKGRIETVKPLEIPTLPEPTTPVTESEPAVPEMAADVKFQVVPTPRKRQPRIPEIQEEPVVSATPKPIKVIRRRPEEAPKVFETAPKILPKAMLEGVKLLVDEEADNSIE